MLRMPLPAGYCVRGSEPGEKRPVGSLGVTQRAPPGLCLLLPFWAGSGVVWVIGQPWKP